MFQFGSRCINTSGEGTQQKNRLCAAFASDNFFDSQKGGVSKNFKDPFNADFVLEEASDMGESSSPSWWLNSGAYFITQNGLGMTQQGPLEVGSKWQRAYANYNPGSTDEGIHPQNLFRLITRERWKNAEQEVYFKIISIHESDTEFRNESNGVLLFHRYLDDNNFYYVGFRVDGGAVIKKKVNGVYHTLAFAEVFNNGYKYHRDSMPNLLPVGKWIGIRTVVEDAQNDTVRIVLFVDLERNGEWVKILETTDASWRFHAGHHAQAGFAGVRGDFMDVQFDDYRIKEL